MKNKLAIIAGIAAAMGVMTVQANPINPFTAANLGNVEFGQSTLDSSSVPADTITIFYGVNLSGGIYQYSYEVYDSNGGDVVDSFAVGFNTTVAGAVIGGNYQILAANGLTWNLFGPVQIGGVSGILDFTSLLAPALGNANAQNQNPPSPWASTPGGQQVPIPHIPDGGATVMLLGAALSAMGLLRKKLIA